MNTDKKNSTLSRKERRERKDRPLTWIDVKFCLEVPVKPSAHDGCDGMNMKYCTSVPDYVIQPGIWVVVCPDDDFRQIKSVYWSEDEGLVLFLEFDEHAKLSRLKKLGWHSDD